MIVSQSGRRISRAPELASSTRLPVGSQTKRKNVALDRVFVRSGPDVNAGLEEDVGRPQDVLALVDRIGEVLEPAAPAAVFLGRRSCC